MKKYLALVAAAGYVYVLSKVTCAWAPALGGFGAFCSALVVITTCAVAFGSLLIAGGYVAFLYLKEALFRRHKVKSMNIKRDDPETP